MDEILNGFVHLSPTTNYINLLKNISYERRKTING